MARRALLVINTHSRSGHTAFDQVSAALRSHGIEPIHRDCDGPDALRAWIEAEGPSADLIVVCGGDGSLNTVAPALLKADRPLGIVPTGTANDLARTLDIPSGIEAAAAIVATGQERKIDLGTANDRPFFNVASIGMSVELAHELTPDLKRRFGWLGYAVAALRVLLRAKPFRCIIEVDGERMHALSLQVAVGNGRYYGGGNIVAWDAAIDDGTLHAYSLEFVRSWKIALMLAAFRRGQHGARSDVRALKGTRIKVTTRRRRSVNADGEIVTKTPVVFGVLPKALTVIVPSDPVP